MAGGWRIRGAVSCVHTVQTAAAHRLIEDIFAKAQLDGHPISDGVVLDELQHAVKIALLGEEGVLSLVPKLQRLISSLRRNVVDQVVEGIVDGGR